MQEMAKHYVKYVEQQGDKQEKNPFLIASPHHIALVLENYDPWSLKQVVQVQYQNHQKELVEQVYLKSEK